MQSNLKNELSTFTNLGGNILSLTLVGLLKMKITTCNPEMTEGEEEKEKKTHTHTKKMTSSFKENVQVRPPEW